MTVKELIEKLEKIEDKDREVIISTKSIRPEWIIESSSKYLVIGEY